MINLTSQLTGVVTPLLSPVCNESITRRTSAVLRPVEAGYAMIRRIFLLGSIMNTERIVRGNPLESIFCKSSSSSISNRYATLRSASAMIGNLTWVELTSLMSLIHSSWEPRSLALYERQRMLASTQWQLSRETWRKLANPIIFTSRWSNSSWSLANAPNSVVHT